MNKKEAIKQEKWLANCGKVLMRQQCQDEEIKNSLNQTVSRTLRLRTKVESPCTTAMGKAAQAIRLTAGHSTLRRSRSLLHVALSSSTVISALHDEAQRHIKSLTVPTTTETKHSILSDNEELYSLLINHQKRLSVLLTLHLSLCDGVLTANIDAPRFLWLQTGLRKNLSPHLLYGIL